MLRVSRWLLLILNTGNWLFFAGAVVLLALLATGTAPFATHVIMRDAYPGYEHALLRAVEGLVAIGIAVVFAVDILFRRLLAILATLDAGDPFQLANAARLHHIAWALLAIQLLDLCFGALALHIGSIAHKPIPWSFGLTGWLAVLLLFILARVFRQGAEMRDEIEGTV
ncbi:DUF2975 domain-containing protein [Sphingomonas crusticola]|uniref:DUF2975 domain-containing protein n=1 Tax=Sphingomonas crusticola TaxID=1697973 RepID=UPI000E23C2C7|nr:DUF2975 domain-containing protein [Sphingomonas crusticola]